MESLKIKEDEVQVDDIYFEEEELKQLKQT